MNLNQCFSSISEIVTIINISQKKNAPEISMPGLWCFDCYAAPQANIFNVLYLFYGFPKDFFPERDSKKHIIKGGY